MYRKVDTNLDFASREKEVEDFWKEHDIANKAISQREGCPDYTFYDGPPTANGQPHIGHVLTRVIKDLFPRYHSMKGQKVLRKAGWDTHGLPVEIEVEKLIGISGKEQIEEYGIEPFIKKCRESVWKYKGMWEEFSGVVGFWADKDHPYITYENNYIESCWWALKQIFDKKTRSCCSVSIKVPICEVSNMESLVFKNLCRDSQHRQRDTEQYRSVSHTVIGNTPYLQIVNALLTHSDNLGYINNNVDNDDDYLNTSKPCYSDGILPYKSELVYPIIPVKNENGTYNMCGFVCVDCEKANAFDKSLYDLPLIQGVADGIYDIIFNRIKGKNHEQ